MIAKVTQALIVLVALIALVDSAPSPTTTMLIRERRSTLSEEAETVVKQGSQVNINDVGQLIDLVEKNKASECLARVICELVANNNAHGEAGGKFGRALLKFRSSKHPQAKYYLDAMNAGSKTKQTACKNTYKTCPYQSIEIIEVGNKILKT